MVTPFQRRLPNLLTLMRLVLAGGFFAALNAYRFPDENWGWAIVGIVLFIAAAITDALDGYLARKWDVVTDFGRVMDPFCDKVLILGAFIYLAGPRFVIPERVAAGDFFTMASGVYPWMVVIILSRELLVTGIRGLVEGRGVKFPSTWSGKWKMILQATIVPIVLLLVVAFKPHENAWAAWTRDVLVYLTVLVTVWSGVTYIIRFRELSREADEAEAAAARGGTEPEAGE